MRNRRTVGVIIHSRSLCRRLSAAAGESEASRLVHPALVVALPPLRCSLEGIIENFPDCFSDSRGFGSIDLEAVSLGRCSIASSHTYLPRFFHIQGQHGSVKVNKNAPLGETMKMPEDQFLNVLSYLVVDSVFAMASTCRQLREWCR